MRLRGEREREERAPVEPALEADHGRPARVAARELDRVLDGLGAGVEERGLRRAGERRDRRQPLGVLDVDLVRDDREVGVEEARGLLLHRRDDARVRVADGEAADAAREVDEAVAVDVGDDRAAAVRDHDRQVEAERVGDDALLPLGDLAGARARDLGAKLDRARDGHGATISGCVRRGISGKNRRDGALRRDDRPPARRGEDRDRPVRRRRCCSRRASTSASTGSSASSTTTATRSSTSRSSRRS